MAYTARQRTTAQVRNGIGHRAYRREQARLRREAKANGWPCAWCGRPIDYEAPANSPESFTADHPEAVAQGGALVGQALEPFHRRCNALKSDGVQVVLRDASPVPGLG